MTHFLIEIYFSLIRVLKSKKNKLVLAFFPLLSRSRNMIGRFMKTSLHKPIKILQFLSRGKIQKYLT